MGDAVVRAFCVLTLLFLHTVMLEGLAFINVFRMKKNYICKNVFMQKCIKYSAMLSR